MAHIAAKKPTKSFLDLTDREREEAVKIFDKPLPAGRTRALTRRERERFERAAADTPHVSLRVYDGRRDVVIYLDDELLLQTKAYARKHKTTLPKMIDQALRGLLANGAR